VRQVNATTDAEAMIVVTWMENVALFRDLDRPNVYTWLRGFADDSGM
jgi:hypothetical protein